MQYKKTNTTASARISIKIDPELKHILVIKAAENFMSLSQLMIQAAKNSKVIQQKYISPPITNGELLLLSAINKVGGQLNMVAKHCNNYKSESDTVKILNALGLISQHAQRLADLRESIITKGL